MEVTTSYMTTSDVTTSDVTTSDVTETFNVTSQIIPTTPLPSWAKSLDNLQLALTIIGAIANLVSLITLLKNGKAFQPVVLLLLRHQSFIDMWACVFGALLMVLPSMALPGVYILDTIICQAWHGQAVYWGTLWVSVWNLVVIAYERYLAVCHPFKHQDFTKKKAYTTLLIGYPLSIVTTIGAYVQSFITAEGTCVYGSLIKGVAGEKFFIVFSVSTLFTYWGIPGLLFFFLYGFVVLAFRKRKQQTNLANSRVIDSATTELTKTAIVVTVIFLLAFGWDIWYYFVGNIGIATYENGTPWQKIGLVFATFNSIANPFVYTMLMPVYRKSLMATFGCLKIMNMLERPKSQSQESVNSTNTVKTEA